MCSKNDEIEIPSKKVLKTVSHTNVMRRYKNLSRLANENTIS